MKRIIATALFASLTLFVAPAICHASTENLFRTNPEKSIIFNEDPMEYGYRNGNFTSSGLASWADQFVDTNVGTIMLNTQSGRANYSGYTTEAYWEGVAHDSDYWTTDLNGLRQKHYTGMLNGIEFTEERIKLLRERGISPWVSIRMNDVHDMSDMDNPLHATFTKQHQSMLVGANSPFYDDQRCLNYLNPEVRNWYFATIRENIERYDMDGLELDFMRESYTLFDAADRAALTEVYTQLVKDIRKVLDQYEMVRGHEIYLGVRVPAAVHVAVDYGLDVEEWSRLGLVDLVCVTARWATSDTDMEIEKWTELLKTQAGNKNIIISAGIESIYRSNYGQGPGQYTGIETTRGMAHSFLSRGADCIYLYNHMNEYIGTGQGHMYNQFRDWKPMLQQVNSIENMAGLVRRHAITFRDRVAHNENVTSVLPIALTPATPQSQELNVHVGSVSETYDTDNYIIIGVNQNYNGTGAGAVTSAGDASVKINGVECPYVGDVVTINEPRPKNLSYEPFDLIRYKVPKGILKSGYNAVVVEALNGKTIELQWVEVYMNSSLPGMRNLALNKTVTASSYYEELTHYIPERAVDGTVDLWGWTPMFPADTKPDWWMLDLGEAYNVSRIEIVARQLRDGGDEGNVAYRSNFKVQGSADAAFTAPVEIASTGSYGQSVIEPGGTWNITIPEENITPIRYVRIIEQDNENVAYTFPFLTEVRVFE